MVQSIEWLKTTLNSEQYSTILDTIVTKNFKFVKIKKLENPLIKKEKTGVTIYSSFCLRNSLLLTFFLTPLLLTIVHLISKVYITETIFFITILLIFVFDYIRSQFFYSNKIVINYYDCNTNNPNRDLQFMETMVHELVHYIYFNGYRNKFKNLFMPVFYLEGIPTYVENFFLNQYGTERKFDSQDHYFLGVPLYLFYHY